MRPEPYNFANPQFLRHGVREEALAWLRRAAVLAQKTWPRHLPFAAELCLERLESRCPPDALADPPETAVGCRVTVNGDIVTLLVLPRPLLLLLVSGLLGDASAQPPGDRELTPVEQSLADYALQHLLLNLCQETWEGAEPLRLELGPQEPQTRWRRLFAEDNLLACAFSVKGAFGRLEWRWLLPQKRFVRLLSGPDCEAPAPEADAEVRPRLEALVKTVPVTLSVTLGAAEVPFAQLTQLRVGDVLVLDQRIAEPLTAQVAGVKKFLGWPGRVGSRQAFRIDSLAG